MGLGFLQILPTRKLRPQTGIMGLTKLFTKPPKNKLLPSTYDLLFCEDLKLYETQIDQPGVYPWNILFSHSSTNNDLHALIHDPSTATRVRILAYRKLLENGGKAFRKELLGVIVEVGKETGHDILASYKDGTARYIDQSGKIIAWEVSDERSDFLTSELFYESENIVKKIGPWDKQSRLAPPGKGLARITFLMSDGLYFGQAPIADLFHDSLSGPALAAATLLMKHLTEKTLLEHQ